MSEIFGGGGLENAFEALNINAKRTYKSSYEPYYEVWELNKKDLRTLEEVMEWDDSWGWFRYARGSNMGSAADFFTVNGQFLIGWETHDGKDTYNSLMDYFCDGLGVEMECEVCALAVDLARANGLSLGRLFQTYEG